MSATPYDPRSMFDLTGQVAIVTGASSGLGERFARVLHDAGAHVVAVARRVDRLEALAAEHERIVPHAADVTDDVALKRLVDDTMDRFGRIDILVNNAGMGTSERALDEDLDSFRYTLEVNLVAVFNLARLVARPMLETGKGSIVNIASIYGLGSSWPIPNGGYTASKGGVVQLTRELACQWAKGGVRVNAIAPGFFVSEATAEMVANPKSIAYVEKGTPMRRFGQAHELDGALMYLASDASTFMTGQTMTVDGGWTAH
ncbi:SDR family NAD(P)-dependent oxidoreductase [Aeromicrobium sp. S22]|uniref:SDR family NAD(P)-dependent oxidoreductase n=1 Tax=Aeromicrobium sp. S22 TaxID=2662029 RepID=UPI001E3495F9|nr:glucose 1-dehydrogenase [Aeromicrobium sp. S22]